MWGTGFSGHVVAHLLLGMLGPLVLVLADPFGLVLPGLDPPGRRRVLRAAHAPLLRMLSLAPVAWALAVLTPWALWLTPIYSASERHDLVHLLVHVHVIVAGTIFASVVLGIGPLGRRTSPAAGLLMVALSLPAHALLGLVVLSMDQPLLEATGDPAGALADQRTGALVLWVGGDLVATAMLAAAFPRWMRTERRHARREDAAVDALAGRVVPVAGERGRASE